MPAWPRRSCVSGRGAHFYNSVRHLHHRAADRSPVQSRSWVTPVSFPAPTMDCWLPPPPPLAVRFCHILERHLVQLGPGPSLPSADALAFMCRRGRDSRVSVAPYAHNLAAVRWAVGECANASRRCSATLLAFSRAAVCGMNFARFFSHIFSRPRFLRRHDELRDGCASRCLEV